MESSNPQDSKPQEETRKRFPKRILVVLAIAVLLGVAVYFLLLPAPPAPVDAGSVTVEDVKKGPGECKIGPYSLKFPNTWTVKQESEEEYIYPDYGGMLYVYKQSFNTSITDENCRAAFITFLDNLKSDKQAAFDYDTTSIRRVEVNGAIAYRCGFTTKREEEIYRGSIELVMVDTTAYAAMMAVPVKMYEEKKADISTVLDSITIEAPPSENLTSAPAEEPSPEAAQDETEM